MVFGRTLATLFLSDWLCMQERSVMPMPLAMGLHMVMNGYQRVCLIDYDPISKAAAQRAGRQEHKGWASCLAGPVLHLLGLLAGTLYGAMGCMFVFEGINSVGPSHIVQQSRHTTRSLQPSAIITPAQALALGQDNISLLHWNLHVFSITSVQAVSRCGLVRSYV